MAAISIGLQRVGHYEYVPVDPQFPVLTLCRCTCGAVRDARDGCECEPFGVWAMTHEKPPFPFICAVCGTLALPSNSNLIDGQRFVHRGCESPTGGAP